MQSNPHATYANVEDVLESDAMRNIVTDPAGSPNLFVRKLTGALSGTGVNSYQPDGNFWYQANAGYIIGWLAGTSGTDPDLYLERWDGSAWVFAAASTTTSFRDRVVFNGAGATYFRWRVYAFSGGGSYDLWANHPQ
jgi:hypothetical protein